MRAVFNYNEGGFFTGVTKADLDEEETKRQIKAVYALPALATFIAPPHCGIKEYPKWHGNKWKKHQLTYMEDVRVKLHNGIKRIKRLWK